MIISASSPTHGDLLSSAANSSTAQKTNPQIHAGRLGAYYTERGEAPGVWLGSGMAELGIAEGATVTEDQMTALFAHGRHPDAAVIEARMLAGGRTPEEAEKASRLGTPFRTAAAVSELRRTSRTASPNGTSNTAGRRVNRWGGR